MLKIVTEESEITPATREATIIIESEERSELATNDVKTLAINHTAMNGLPNAGISTVGNPYGVGPDGKLVTDPTGKTRPVAWRIDVKLRSN